MAALGVARMTKSKYQINFANTFPFVRTMLTVALLSAVVIPAYALEAMSDANLSNATGEGIAFFANNLAIQMPSVAGDYSTGLSGSVMPGTFGACTDSSTGLTAGCTNIGTATSVGDPGYYGSYIYLSPVGPVSSGNKTDVYLYGLSLSQNDNSTTNTTAKPGLPVGSVVVPSTGAQGATPHNDLFNTAGKGVNLGTAADPFRLFVTSSNAVGLDGVSTPTVPYLVISAPTTVTNDPTSPSYSANNLRLGFWANILQYSGVNATPNYNTNATDTSGTTTAAPALQLQAIIDGFGINGSQINIFPTPALTGTNTATNCASNTNSLACTLGITGVLRFNSQAFGVLRLSVAESKIGVFDPYEGVYIPNLDINLPIGKLNYQPLVLSASNNSATSANITLELGQIPNNSAAYNQFYINYGTANSSDGGDSSSGGLAPTNAAGGGICSSLFCPSSATHGTITIGNVYVNNTGAPVTGLGGSTIYPGYADAQYIANANNAGNPTTLANANNVNGITFKAPGATGATVNLGTAAISGLAINHLKMTLTGL
jgi:hypothetical protein